MPKCPKCNAEIETLTNFVSGEKKFTFDDSGNYEEVDFNECGKVNDYECPECQEVLFKDEEEALAFLKDNPLLNMVEKKIKNEIS